MSDRLASVFSPLVQIQEGSTRLPFFCIHGAGGNVLNFRDIARRLGTTRTFYGLQAKGVDGDEPLATIEQMAALYLPSILSIQRHGPYLLGGYSGGGLVAYEIAQQLKRSGGAVGTLALLDTFGPGVKHSNTSAKQHAAGVMKEGPRYFARRAKARWERSLEGLSAELRTRFYRGQNRPLPQELRVLQMTRAFWEAADRYSPEPYPDPVVLYRAAELGSVFSHVGPRHGWGHLIPRVTIVDVPGDHDSLVYEPNVSVMTNHLRNTLRAAELQSP